MAISGRMDRCCSFLGLPMSIEQNVSNIAQRGDTRHIYTDIQTLPTFAYVISFSSPDLFVIACYFSFNIYCVCVGQVCMAACLLFTCRIPAVRNLFDIMMPLKGINSLRQPSNLSILRAGFRRVVAN